MDTQRRKEATVAWKSRRPNMGVFAVRCEATGDTFVGTSPDTDRAMNGVRARLDTGMHRNKSLQALWDEHGADAFSYEVVELLEYDEPSDDYADDLAALLALVAERFPEAQRL